MFEKINADGDFDFALPDFSEAELERAADLRQRVTPEPGERRRDRCPHAPICKSIGECIERIAWYLRHQHAIEARLKRARTMDAADVRR